MSIAAADEIDDLAMRLSHDVDGAFPELLAAYQDVVFSIAFRVSGSSDDADNLAAESFLRAYQALRRYPDERIAQLRIRPWLVTIVLNLWRNQVRAASHRPRCVPMDEAAEPASRQDGPEQLAQRYHEGRDLAVLLTQLSPPQRVAVVLRHVAGLSYTEIADVLGCPEGTAKSHVARGIRRLRLLIAGTSLQEDHP